MLTTPTNRSRKRVACSVISLFVVASLEILKLTYLLSLLVDLIWENKPYKVRKEVTSLALTEAGLGVLDCSSVNNTSKYPETVWNIIPNFVFQKVSGLQ